MYETIGPSAVIGLSMVISMLVRRRGKSSRPDGLMAARQTCAVFVVVILTTITDASGS
jgi:hypothetical protein